MLPWPDKMHCMLEELVQLVRTFAQNGPMDDAEHGDIATSCQRSEIAHE